MVKNKEKRAFLLMISVGQKLGMIELKLALAKLMQKFEFSLAADQHVKSVHTTTLGPKGGLYINVKSC